MTGTSELYIIAVSFKDKTEKGKALLWPMGTKKEIEKIWPSYRSKFPNKLFENPQIIRIPENSIPDFQKTNTFWKANIAS